MKMLNSIDGFQEARFISPSNGLASASVGYDSFFISECVTYAIGNKSGFVGKIIVNLSKSEVHGLKPNEEVFFTPTR